MICIDPPATSSHRRGHWFVYNHFQYGLRLASIYYTPQTGAHDVYDDIRAYWESLGWEKSFLGYPVTDQSTCPDHTGEYVHFQHDGSIYWSPKTGAHEVHGPIRERWKDLGWEKSFLGYPKSDQMPNPDIPKLGWYSNFQGGFISWQVRPTQASPPVQSHAQEHRNGQPFVFVMDGVRAVAIRTGHFSEKVGNDQDTIAMEARVNGKVAANHHRYIGDVSNGQYKSVNDSILIPVDDPTARMTLSFFVVNHGDGDTAQLESALKQGFDKINQWADREIVTGAEVLLGGAIGSILGHLLVNIINDLLNAAWNFFEPNCDGPVAYDVIQGSVASINDCISAEKPYRIAKHYPGSNSPSGCGANSDYVVSCQVKFDSSS